MERASACNCGFSRSRSVWRTEVRRRSGDLPHSVSTARRAEEAWKARGAQVAQRVWAMRTGKRSPAPDVDRTVTWPLSVEATYRGSAVRSAQGGPAAVVGLERERRAELVIHRTRGCCWPSDRTWPSGAARARYGRNGNAGIGSAPFWANGVKARAERSTSPPLRLMSRELV